MADTATEDRTGFSLPNALDEPTYEGDFYGWAMKQSALLSAGRLDEIDLENIAEELSGLAKSEFSRLRSTLRVLVMHMLKWDQQPEHRTPSWIYSIHEQRRRFHDIVSESPSLKPRIEEALRKAYPSARDWASDETHLTPDEFPKSCPYDWDDILNRPFELDSLKR